MVRSNSGSKKKLNLKKIIKQLENKKISTLVNLSPCKAFL